MYYKTYAPVYNDNNNIIMYSVLHKTRSIGVRSVVFMGGGRRPPRTRYCCEDLRRRRRRFGSYTRRMIIYHYHDYRYYHFFVAVCASIVRIFLFRLMSLARLSATLPSRDLRSGPRAAGGQVTERGSCCTRQQSDTIIIST